MKISFFKVHDIFTQIIQFTNGNKQWICALVDICDCKMKANHGNDMNEICCLFFFAMITRAILFYSLQFHLNPKTFSVTIYFNLKSNYWTGFTLLFSMQWIRMLNICVFFNINIYTFVVLLIRKTTIDFCLVAKNNVHFDR